MKTKKIFIALAIFGGVLFTAEAANVINLDGQLKTEIDKRKIKIPGQGQNQ